MEIRKEKERNGKEEIIMELEEALQAAVAVQIVIESIKIHYFRAFL